MQAPRTDVNQLTDGVRAYIQHDGLIRSHRQDPLKDFFFLSSWRLFTAFRKTFSHFPTVPHKITCGEITRHSPQETPQTLIIYLADVEDRARAAQKKKLLRSPQSIQQRLLMSFAS